MKYLLEVCDPARRCGTRSTASRCRTSTRRGTSIRCRSSAARYSFTGAIERPIQILDGGYLSWIDPEDSGLYQLDVGRRSSPCRIADLTQLARSTAPLRTVVDTSPLTPQLAPEGAAAGADGGRCPGAYDAVAAASEGAALRTAQAVVSLAFHAG